MSLLYLAGEDLNLVGRGPNAVTTAGTVNSLFPVANVYSGRPAEPFSFSQAIASMRVIVDGQQVAEGGFEASLASWTDADTGDGASTEEGTIFSEGAASLKLVPGASGVAARYQDVTVRTGERLRISADIRQDGTGSVELYVLNRQTGKQLNTSGAWVASASAAALETTADTSAAFSAESLEFQAETRAQCGGRNTVTLRITARSASSGVTAGYVDDVVLVPAVNFLGIFGHNLAPLVTPTWRSDDDSAFGSAVTRGTPTIAQPNFFSYLSTAIYARYWDLLLSGTPLENPRFGELVMGYAETLGRKQEFGWEDAHSQPQVRMESLSGDEYVENRGPYPLRRLKLPLKHLSLAQRDEVKHEILGRSGFGATPVIVVPVDSEPDVLFGRAEKDWALLRKWNVISTETLSLREFAHMDWIDG